jgi:hypothetical protein
MMSFPFLISVKMALLFEFGNAIFPSFIIGNFEKMA